MIFMVTGNETWIPFLPQLTVFFLKFTQLFNNSSSGIHYWYLQNLKISAIGKRLEWFIYVVKCHSFNLRPAWTPKCLQKHSFLSFLEQNVTSTSTYRLDFAMSIINFIELFSIFFLPILRNFHIPYSAK